MNADEAANQAPADAGIRHIHTTGLTRTRQTAAPTARLAGVEPVVVPQADPEGLIAKVRATARPGEATLVVGHRGTAPRIAGALPPGLARLGKTCRHACSREP